MISQRLTHGGGGVLENNFREGSTVEKYQPFSLSTRYEERHSKQVPPSECVDDCETHIFTHPSLSPSLPIQLPCTFPAAHSTTSALSKKVGFDPDKSILLLSP